ncbi:MAG: hypothetical protein GWO02_08745 [Gammaproteobacteria bacterium]|nr:hypothetical protein [Gammaproteobacteria bacterium]
MSNQLDFQPQRTVVEPGQTVQWKNSSLLVHTVTAVPHLAARAEHVAVPDGGEPFNSGNMEPDDTFRHTFEVPGTYRYFCIPHEGAGMVGEVVVEE